MSYIMTRVLESALECDHQTQISLLTFKQELGLILNEEFNEMIEEL
jgi:hypothetical protein